MKALLKSTDLRRTGFFSASIALFLVLGGGLSTVSAVNVHGRVTGQDAEGEHKGPLAGAKVEFFGAGGTVAGSATANEFGYYRVEGLAAGKYTYKVAASGYAANEEGRGVSLESGEEDYPLDFILTPDAAEETKPAELNGHVWKESAGSRVPVGGARVAARPSAGGEMIYAVTDGQGAYSFELEADTWRASAQVEGLGAKVHESPIALNAGGKEVVDFVFDAANPVKVPPLPDPREETTTQRGGDERPGVHGRVTGVDAEGEHLGPLAGTKVEFLGSGGEVAGTATANEYGYYRVDGLGAGKFTYRLTAEGAWKDDEGRGCEVRAGGGLQVIDFILTKEEEEKPGRIAGTVRREIGGERMPLAGATVHLRQEGEIAFSTLRTRADGSYAMAVPAGSWRLAAMAEPYGSHVHPETVAVPAGGEEGVDFLFTAEMCDHEVYILAAVERLPNEEGPAPEIALFRGREGEGAEVGPLEVETLGADPRGSDFFREFGLELNLGDQSGWQYFLASPAAGVIVETGLYHAMGALDGYFDDVSPIKTVGTGEAAILDLVIERFRPEIEVLVETKDREPIPGVEVCFANQTLGRTLADGIKVATDEAGKCVSELDDGLGEYLVELVCEGFESERRRLVADDEFHELRVQMFRTGETPTVDLAGIVIEASAGPRKPGGGAIAIGNAIVELTPQGGQPLPPGLRQPMATDGSGGFAIAGLREGEYAVRAGAEGYEVWEGMLKVQRGMEQPAVFELEAFNREFENHIRMILTDGWGPSGTAVAQRHYQLAVQEDPEDCRADYAMALAYFSASNVRGGLEPLGKAVAKKNDDLSWDRVCEARIWAQMFVKAGAAASQEILALCQHHYAQRTPNEGSKETALVLGIAVGVLNGPWNSQATAQKNAELDAACLAALQDPHRSEYVRGRESVASDYGQLAQQEEAAKKQLMEGAAAEQARMAEAAMGRINQIDAEIGPLQSRAALNTNQFNQNWAGFNLNMEKQKVQGLMMNINSLNAQKSQTHDCGCGGHAGYLADCQSCVARYQQKCFNIDNQVRMYNQQYQQALAQLQAMEARYNRDLNAINNANAQINAQLARLQAERRQLEGQANARPDIEGMMERESRKFDEAKKAFIRYRTYPLEERRQELLKAVTR